MSSNNKIYGIKNCDTVKKALKYLSTNDITYEFIDFRVDPISKNELQKMIEKVGLEVLINKRSTTYRTLTESEKDNIDPPLACHQLGNRQGDIEGTLAGSGWCANF